MAESRTSAGRERAILVGLDEPNQTGPLDERLEELTLLADTAGCDAMACLTQARAKPDPKTCIGKGKVEEVVEAVAEHEADVVIFDRDLSPAQARNLEAAIERTVIDRTQLILDIFARRAKTHLARWEVELAQLQYELPRFRRMWTHLSRIEGGVGIGGRGPGETQLEVDRRRARERIHLLQERLHKAERQKAVASGQRERIFTVALVGYTNVGKSTLMNALSGADVLVENRLFATLDATTRRIELDGEGLLLTDTVGFIRDLPHTLVASFHATLAEVTQADLLLHVVDISSPQLEDQMFAVAAVLEEIGASERPVLQVFNKADALEPDLDAESIAARHGGGVVVSAATGQGLGELTSRLLATLRAQHQEVVLEIPYTDGRTPAYLEENAKVLEREYGPSGVRITALVSEADAGRLSEYVVD